MPPALRHSMAWLVVVLVGPVAIFLFVVLPSYQVYMVLFHSVRGYLFDALVLVLLFLAIATRPRDRSQLPASGERLDVDETLVLSTDLVALDGLLARSG